MGLKNKVLILFFGIFMSGCFFSTKEIDEQYLSKIRTSEEIIKTDLFLHITGLYGESAWGIDSTKNFKDGNILRISGTVKLGSKAPIDFKIKIPSDVDEIYFYSQKIWSRKHIRNSR